MKRYLRYLFFSFLFLCLTCVSKVSAKSSVSSAFEVSVGDGDTLPVYYSLVEDSGVVKEQIHFSVTLRGKESNGRSFKWEHTLCYKISGASEVCEVDYTGKDIEGSNDIVSNEEYNYTFYDSDMPFYSDSLVFEYVKFNNKFVCLDEGSSDEYTLDELYFDELSISYKYKFDAVHSLKSEKVGDKIYISPSIYTNNGVKFSYFNSTFVNNSSSNLTKENSPTYKFIVEVCGYPRDENECTKNEYDTVTSNNNVISITPYIGNITYQNVLTNLDYKDNSIQYEYAIYTSKLECLSNCDDRRVSSIVVISEDTFYFKYTVPVVDTSKTIINSSNESVNYVKNSEVTISVSDNLIGINEDSLVYYLIKPYSTYCAYGTSSKYKYSSDVKFTIGDNLNGGYCMYYEASDKLGNKYTSDYYIFYFDNSGPSMSLDNTYDSNRYYNEIILNPTFSDYVDVDNKYYLWSEVEVSEENYIDVKNKGVLFDSEINSDSLNDGTYYLYILVYDSLGNYKYYSLGKFNVDKTELVISDVNVRFDGDNENYSNTNKLQIYVSEMDDNESFKCGFFNGSVSVSDLNLTCQNGVDISYPSSLEGKYSFYVYVRDRAYNYSLLEVKKDLLIDTLAPRINYSILYDDNEYHVTNEITVNVIDLNGVSDLKYGWFVATKSNVTSLDLVDGYSNEGVIGYPSSYYGEYKLYLKAIDDLGNENFYGLDKIFKVDTDVVRISLVGDETIRLIRNEKYEELGAKAYKGSALTGGRISKVDISGNVDTSKKGVYYITYSSGEGSYRVSVVRKVIVTNNVPYIVSACSLFVLGSVGLCFRLFIRRKND